MRRPWYINLLIIGLIGIVLILWVSSDGRWYARLAACLLFGITTAFGIWQSTKWESAQSFDKTSSRFSPYIPPWLLPLFFVLCLILSPIFLGLSHTVDYIFPAFTRIFLHISIYNAILLLLLPCLRKRLSAKVCAALWMLPNILYIAYNSMISPEQPLLIIPIPIQRKGLWLLIWFIGFAGTLLHQIINHLLFRRKILKNAKRVWDMDIQRIWYEVLEDGQFRTRNYPIMYSEEILTPLSIGFFPKTTYVILPHREYAQEELRLIFRHEAIHIGRQDCFAKFFMTFCACICWFNPVSWMAVRYCSTDMELSCDEIVLLKENQETKRRYAELLLKTAGSDRGFSSCLSASSKAMFYRLTHVLNPPKRYLGAIAAGIAMFLLLSTCGLVAVAHTPVTGESIISSIDHADSHDEFICKAGEDRTTYACEDISLLLDYVSSITFYQLSGHYSYPDDDVFIVFYYAKADYQNNDTSTGIIPGGGVEIALDDHTLTIIDFTAGVPTTEIHYHNTVIDWDYLLSLGTPVS